MSPEEVQQLTKEISDKLGESDEGPVRQIVQIIELCGADFAKKMLEETMEIEEKGGMKTHKGDRRRTPGGVYFFIAKGKMDEEMRHKIFPNYGQSRRNIITWENRVEKVKALLEAEYEESAEVRTVRTIVRGRPTHIEIMDDSIVMIFEYAAAKIPYPRGVPNPPEDPIRHLVYMGTKHWTKIEEVLEKNPKDYLIIEGIVQYDKELDVLAVYAINVSSKELDKQAPKPEAESKDKAEKKGKKEQPKAKDGKGKKSKAPAPQKAPVKVLPQIDIDLPEGIPDNVATKLKQLHSAAATLRQRISDMEEKGQQAGIDMTRKLLRNTERQIEALEKQYS